MECKLQWYTLGGLVMLFLKRETSVYLKLAFYSCSLCVRIGTIFTLLFDNVLRALLVLLELTLIKFTFSFFLKKRDCTLYQMRE